MTVFYEVGGWLVVTFYYGNSFIFFPSRMNVKKKMRLIFIRFINHVFGRNAYIGSFIPTVTEWSYTMHAMHLKNDDRALYLLYCLCCVE